MGLVCCWTIAMIELSAIGKYKCIFFLMNAKEQNVDRCHRKSPGADDWPVIYTAVRACTGVCTLLLRHVKV